VGFAQVLEACRRHPPKNVVYASSSSVYGAGAKPPFREDDDTTQPTSFYGATKKSNELMAQSYARVHGLNLTGLRFFTAYGPWGRPDMAPTLFARALCEGAPVPLFNEGKNLRDFTYIDDIVDGVIAALLYPHPPSPSRIFNLGHNRPVETLLFVRMLEQLLGRTARIELLPAQAGDMLETCADLTRVHAAINYAPKVSLEQGLARFVDWFTSYYKI
jgi:UDP-glucuronate 4-epimerase